MAFLYLALRMGGRPTDVLRPLPGLLERAIEDTDAQVQILLPVFAERGDMYELGYGLTYGIALEGALKLKEITYAHCEGMLSTEFKHGPLSAVDEGYPVVFVAGPDDVPKMLKPLRFFARFRFAVRLCCFQSSPPPMSLMRNVSIVASS